MHRPTTPKTTGGFSSDRSQPWRFRPRRAPKKLCDEERHQLGRAQRRREVQYRRARGRTSHGPPAALVKAILCAGAPPPKTTPVGRYRPEEVSAARRAADEVSVSRAFAQFAALDHSRASSAAAAAASDRQEQLRFGKRKAPRPASSRGGGTLRIGRPMQAGNDAGGDDILALLSARPSTAFGTSISPRSRRREEIHEEIVRAEMSLVGNQDFSHTVASVRPMTCRPGSPRRYSPRSMQIHPSWAAFRSESEIRDATSRGIFQSAFADQLTPLATVASTDTAVGSPTATTEAPPSEAPPSPLEVVKTTKTVHFPATTGGTKGKGSSAAAAVGFEIVDSGAASGGAGPWESSPRQGGSSPRSY